MRITSEAVAYNMDSQLEKKVAYKMESQLEKKTAVFFTRRLHRGLQEVRLFSSLIPWAK
jgi:hypothetical protein